MKADRESSQGKGFAGVVISGVLAGAAAAGLLWLGVGMAAAVVLGLLTLYWALVQEKKMRRIEASRKPVSPEELEQAGLCPLPADATARDLYLDTMKRTLLNIPYHESSAPMWRTSAETGRCSPIRAMDLDRRMEGADFCWNALTLLGWKRLDNLRFCVESVLEQKVPGDFLEAGAFKGGGCIFMKAVLRAHAMEKDAAEAAQRTIFVCDTFSAQAPPPHIPRWLLDHGVSRCVAALASIPSRAWRRTLVKAYLRAQSSFPATHDPSDHAIDVVGTFLRYQWEHSPLGGIPAVGNDLESVRSHFARFGLLDDRVQFLRGFFSETFPHAPIEALAILRIDCDTYESTLDALRPLYDKLSEGGYCIIDDYFEYPDCRQAVEDFRTERGLSEPIHRIDWNGGYWIKGDSAADSPA